MTDHFSSTHFLRTSFTQGVLSAPHRIYITIPKGRNIDIGNTARKQDQNPAGETPSLGEFLSHINGSTPPALLSVTDIYLFGWLHSLYVLSQVDVSWLATSTFLSFYYNPRFIFTASHSGFSSLEEISVPHAAWFQWLSEVVDGGEIHIPSLCIRRASKAIVTWRTPLSLLRMGPPVLEPQQQELWFAVAFQEQKTPQTFSFCKLEAQLGRSCPKSPSLCSSAEQASSLVSVSLTITAFVNSCLGWNTQFPGDPFLSKQFILYFSAHLLFFILDLNKCCQ